MGLNPKSAPSSPFAAKITGTGSAFPKKRMTNDEVATRVETNDQWIRERTGIAERRISDVRNPDEQNSSLAYAAALKALEMAGKKSEDIDQIIYGTCTPDTLLPSSACWLQKKLGAKRANAMDVNAACSGFVYALSVADQFIRSGQSKCTLVVGAEVTSQYINWKDRGVSILFGDGAGAVILEATSPDSKSRILSTHLGSDGDLWELFHIPAGGSNLESSDALHVLGETKMKMKGPEIFKIAVRTLGDYAARALEANGLTLADVDWVIPHQANLRIIEAAMRRLDFPMERVVVNVDRYANTSAATVPTALDEAVRDGRIKPGQVVLFTVFGAGLTFGSAVLRF